MSIQQHRSEQAARTAAKTDPTPYEWTHQLPSLGWAWEFVRRDPNYHADFAASKNSSRAEKSGIVSASERWPFLRLADPLQDARVAEIFWRRDVVPSVLPLASTPLSSDEATQSLPLENMQCRVTVIDDGEVHHVLLSQDGRSLQLEVHGPLTGAVLLTPALPQHERASSRLAAMMRLIDVVRHGVLRPKLYPPEGRAQRFATMLQALDGALTKTPYRDIAVGLFGVERVEKEWTDPGNHMRDHVRRAVVSGREMMESGYRRLLD